MSKRLQVIAADLDYREIQHSAKSPGISIAEWVRQALNSARRRELASPAGKKMDVVRAAVRHAYATRDIDIMLAEIESGYGTAKPTRND
jgi:hypothetical protein